MEAANTPPADQPADPTPAQGAAIGQASVAAATAPGQTPAERQAAAEQATAAKAKELNLTISDSDVKRIASETIRMLEAAGAFDQPPAAPAETSGAQPADPQAATAGAASAAAPAPAPAGEQAPAAGQPPRKPSFAERFQGKR